MPISDELHAVIELAATKAAQAAIKEYDKAVDNKIELHHSKCANAKYNKAVTVLLSIATALGVTWLTNKFFH